MIRLSTRTTLTTFAVISVLAFAVQPPTLAQELEQTLIQHLSWRNIGNANQRGRISTIDALADDWTHVVVGTASGGVWKSTNGGTTWAPIFEDYGAASIGDVAIFQADPNIIWVGTGEECGRNSSAWGDGIYKSTDGGVTFTHMGLGDTYTIGAVVTHPTDPDIVYVAALGNIWGNVGDRGLFKTTDGGETWEKLTAGLPDDYDNTGALYAVIDPNDSDTLYVSFWERHRTPFTLLSGGEHGGIYKTTNAGAGFTKLTQGLPKGPSGKIGLAISQSNPNVLMAHYEHGFQPARDDPAYEDMSQLGTGVYRSEDGGDTWMFQNRYFSRPFYYNHVAISPLNDLNTYHPNQNFQASTDGGRTLERMNGGEGHCYHTMWLDPHDANRFWVGSDGGLGLTHDLGENWVMFKNINVTQYYFVGVDMRDPYWVYGGLQDAGTSGGPSLTRSRGIYMDEWINVQGGDGYFAAIDPTDWTTVYTGQDPKGTGSSVSRTDLITRQRTVIRPMKGLNIMNYDEVITPEMEAANIAKGWGPPVVGRQDESRSLGSGAFRWNWASPIVLSPNDPHTLYVGTNHLFKSTDRGDTWWIISPDLSKNDPEKTLKESGGLTSDAFAGGGAEYYGTIVTVAESPVRLGVIWVGTDDGNVQVTRDSGKTWTNVALNISGLPSDSLYVSRVRPSKSDAATAFVSIEGHESAVFDPYVFKTTDYGESWTNITSNLPAGNPIYSLEQDNVNPDLLFAGSEFQIFYSIDGGGIWTRFNNNLPTVAVHDILVHPRDPDLIIGTHGRGLWIMDDISTLQQLTPEIVASQAHLFDNEVATQWLRQEPMYNGGAYAFVGENPTKNAVIDYWLGSGVSEPVVVRISDAAGQPVRSCTVPVRFGPGKLEWDMRGEPPGGGAPQSGCVSGGGGRGGRGGRGGGAGALVAPGTYRLTMTVNGTDHVSSISIRSDPVLDAGR